MGEKMTALWKNQAICLLNKVKMKLKDSFQIEADHIGNDYFELLGTHNNGNFKIRLDFAEWQEKNTTIIVYKRNKNNIVRNDRIKVLTFDLEQKNEILQAIVSIKREIELKEIFIK